MLKKSVTPFLLCAAMLLAAAPSKALAQTAALSEQTAAEGPAGERARPKPELKATFAEVAAKKRADTISKAELKRLESGWLKPQTGGSSGGMSTKEKVLIVAIVVVIVGLAIVLAHNSDKVGNTTCDVDPFDPNCIGAP
jgi:hypothetical protein